MNIRKIFTHFWYDVRGQQLFSLTDEVMQLHVTELKRPLKTFLEKVKNINISEPPPNMSTFRKEYIKAFVDSFPENSMYLTDEYGKQDKDQSGNLEYFSKDKQDKYLTEMLNYYINDDLEYQLSGQGLFDNVHEIPMAIFTNYLKMEKEVVKKRGQQRTNFQTAYAPVVGKFTNAINKMLKDLETKINTPNITNKQQLETIKSEVEQYKKAVDAIGKVIASGTPEQITALLSHGPQTLPEAISKDKITDRVPNVLNTQSSSGTNEKLRIKGDMPETEKIRKRVMLQLKLIGRRMDKLMGKTPKGIADEDVRSGLRDAGVDIDDEAYRAAKEKFDNLNPTKKGSYATGLLGFIKDIFRKGSNAFKELLASNDDKDQQLKSSVVDAAYSEELDKIYDSIDNMGYEVADESLDDLKSKITNQLIKPSRERKKLIFVKITDDDYIPLKKSGSSYEAGSWNPYANEIRKEVNRVMTSISGFKKDFQGTSESAPPPEQVAQRIFDEYELDAALFPTIDGYKQLFDGSEIQVKKLIKRAVNLERNTVRTQTRENKKRKGVKSLIHLIEIEMRKHNIQANTKRIQHG